MCPNVESTSQRRIGTEAVSVLGYLRAVSGGTTQITTGTYIQTAIGIRHSQVQGLARTAVMPWMFLQHLKPAVMIRELLESVGQLRAAPQKTSA